MLRGGTVVAGEDLAVGSVWETRFHASPIKQSGPLSPTNDDFSLDRGNQELEALHVFGPVDGAKPLIASMHPALTVGRLLACALQLTETATNHHNSPISMACAALLVDPFANPATRRRLRL